MQGMETVFMIKNKTKRNGVNYCSQWHFSSLTNAPVHCFPLQSWVFGFSLQSADATHQCLSPSSFLWVPHLQWNLSDCFVDKPRRPVLGSTFRTGWIGHANHLCPIKDWGSAVRFVKQLPAQASPSLKVLSAVLGSLTWWNRPDERTALLADGQSTISCKQISHPGTLPNTWKNRDVQIKTVNNQRVIGVAGGRQNGGRWSSLHKNHFLFIFVFYFCIWGHVLLAYQKQSKRKLTQMKFRCFPAWKQK